MRCLIAIPLALSLVALACSSDDDDSTEATPPAEQETATPEVADSADSAQPDPPQSITVSVEGLEGYEGFRIASYVTEADPQQRETRLAEFGEEFSLATRILLDSFVPELQAELVL